jgi:hypothetical protein
VSGGRGGVMLVMFLGLAPVEKCIVCISARQEKERG